MSGVYCLRETSCSGPPPAMSSSTGQSTPTFTLSSSLTDTLSQSRAHYQPSYSMPAQQYNLFFFPDVNPKQGRVSEHPAYRRNTDKGEDGSRPLLRRRTPLPCLRAPPDNHTLPSALRTPKSETMSSPSPLSSSLNSPLKNILVTAGENEEEREKLCADSKIPMDEGFWSTRGYRILRVPVPSRSDATNTSDVQTLLEHLSLVRRLG
ncbi:hypothetical protein BKA82DRAFT_940703 [Pisolithus tinctorius]|uniref:Uncharacterized protein n=1 Tax=Pisolithus tinctorius Marx 270 TaxID=870435 RepID=A0A0C3JFE5_PISTI|nr:hypothetical protein BKA82DRAFT_940703 [Pisolithus tinctorius]KIO07793.1 hypothetical protein M404DRAFT_940703 [Pisolithus tinctorius Marx 270]